MAQFRDDVINTAATHAILSGESSLDDAGQPSTPSFEESMAFWERRRWNGQPADPVDPETAPVNPTIPSPNMDTSRFIVEHAPPAKYKETFADRNGPLQFLSRFGGEEADVDLPEADAALLGKSSVRQNCAPLSVTHVPNSLGVFCRDILEPGVRRKLSEVRLTKLLSQLDPEDWLIIEDLQVDWFTIPIFLLGPRGLFAIFVTNSRRSPIGAVGERGRLDEISVEYAALAQRRLEQELPDGRPINIIFWIDTQDVVSQRSVPLFPDNESILATVIAGPHILNSILQWETNWPLPPRIGMYARAASQPLWFRWVRSPFPDDRNLGAQP